MLFAVIGVFWLIRTISESIKKANDHAKKQAIAIKIQIDKYGERKIDRSLTLFERNQDIISEFSVKIRSSYQGHYYEDNLIRDCLNEICLAEGCTEIAPNHRYLYQWDLSAPPAWKSLRQSIEIYFNEKKQQLIQIDQMILSAQKEVNEAISLQKEPLTLRDIIFTEGRQNDININVLKTILESNSISWIDTERDIIDFDNQYSTFKKLSFALERNEVQNLNRKIESYNEQQEKNAVVKRDNAIFFKEILSRYKLGEEKAVEDRVNFIINAIHWSVDLPKLWKVKFDLKQKILVVEMKLPDVVHTTFVKDVFLKKGITTKPLNQREKNEHVPSIQPAMILRTAYEIFKNDIYSIISLLVINGWVEFDDPATGKRKRTHTASIALNRNDVLQMNFEKIEPLTAFKALKGKSAGKLIDNIPVEPILKFDQYDSRYIETREVLDTMNPSTNIACMDWQDFESLIAELFQKEYEEEGVEVHTTQASRDRGVDVIITDPNPIHGGKTIVQAKRYTNTVDISAVRELYGVMGDEGAVRGILITTSNYGHDAYKFAQNKPIVLLTGNDLLGLLKKHGYTFHIDINQARKINKANEQSQMRK